MDFVYENIAFIMSILVSIVTFLAMNWAKIPLKTLTKLLPFCKNKRISTAINAGAGLSESCVIGSLLISLINLIGHLEISADWGILAGGLANFAYLFVENIGKAKNGELTEEDQEKAAKALDETAEKAQELMS